MMMEKGDLEPANKFLCGRLLLLRWLSISKVHKRDLLPQSSQQQQVAVKVDSGGSSFLHFDSAINVFVEQK